MFFFWGDANVYMCWQAEPMMNDPMETDTVKDGSSVIPMMKRLGIFSVAMVESDIPLSCVRALKTARDLLFSRFRLLYIPS